MTLLKQLKKDPRFELGMLSLYRED